MNTKQKAAAMNKMTEDAYSGGGSGSAGSVRRIDRRRFDRRGFTLVELLVVIALSGLILALLFAPIIQGFHLTAKAKALVQAQDASRNGLEQFSREVSQASYVFDNSTMPIILPLEQPDTTGGNTAAAPKRHQSSGNAIYPTSTAGGYVVAPAEAFGRIDLISSDVSSSGSAAMDPTTNTPIGGADLRVPIAPASHRYVRYFIGLLSNTDSTGTVEKYYQNLYEFHGSSIDQDFNPFILYRAEYDPNDPNLIPQSKTTGPVLQTPANSTDSGFDDPNFFYNLTTASTSSTRMVSGSTITGNGKSYAANWKAIASPVVVGKNLDMLIWRRNSNGAIDPNTPFTLGATFAPAAVVNDVATPGFLTNAEAEAPSALPTLYTSQFGAWTFPFTINVIRGSTQQLPVPPPSNGGYGAASFTFGYATSTNGSPGTLTCTVTPATPAIPSNTLDPQIDPVTHTATANTSNIYAVYSPLTGKYFVSTPSISFIVDTARGRIETGIPPLANLNGQIYFNAYTANGQQVGAIAGSTSPATVVNGDLLTTIYRQSTLDNVYAGVTYTSATGAGAGTVPYNQGITFSDLQAGATDADSSVVGYFLLTSLQTPINGLGGFTKYESPFRPNVIPAGDSVPPGFDGALLAIGTERVVGPDNNLTAATRNATGVNASGSTTTLPLMVDYNRVPSGPADLAKNSVGSTVAGALYSRNSPLNYQFDPRLQLTNEPILEYDTHQPDYSTASTTYLPFLISNLPAGLPTPAKNSTANPTPPATDVQVSFLWQNNYARKTIADAANTTNGIDEVPIDANANDQAQVTGGTFQPEPDVFQVTYSTRSLINVALGARVYDIYSGQPVFVQVTNKIKVNNVGR